MLREKYTIESLKDFAQKKQGVCLSEVYKTNKQKYKWQCELGHSWESIWMDVKAGHWCPICKGIKNSTIKTKYSLKDLKDYAERREGLVLSLTYTSTEAEYQWKCKKGHEWKTVWANMLYSKSWCPVCCNSSGYSRPQTEILNFIKQFEINALEKQKFLGRKELDILVPELKLAIEYCGIYWHTEDSPTPRGRNYHNSKRLECEKQGIRLITMFSDEWETRKPQVKNFLKSVLGINTKLFARKCSVEELTPTIAKTFYENNHIQGGKVNINIAFGLKFENEIVGVVSGAKHHRGSDGLVLNRLAFKDGIQILGGASKLLKPLINYAKQQGYSKIISWSDNRWSQGNVYKQLGFILEEELPPDYSYVDLKDTDKRLSKQAHNKTALLKKGAKGATESEMAKSIGLTRIWDCGKKRWAYNIP
jgi:hypothetical protein